MFEGYETISRILRRVFYRAVFPANHHSPLSSVTRGSVALTVTSGHLVCAGFREGMSLSAQVPVFGQSFWARFLPFPPFSLQAEVHPGRTVGSHPTCKMQTQPGCSSGDTDEALQGTCARPSAGRCQHGSLPAARSPGSDFWSIFCTLEQTAPVTSPFPQRCIPVFNLADNLKMQQLLES